MFPRGHERNNRTKRNWVSFYNEEAERVLEHYLVGRTDNDTSVFSLSLNTTFKTWKKAAKRAGVYIMPQVLRGWFCCEMGSLGVQDRYVDAFCGRTPKSVLARHYTDYSPERLKRLYDKAGLRVLS